MKPRKFIGANHTFKLPGGTDKNDLPVWASRESDEPVHKFGEPRHMSVWELTDEDRQRIAGGADIVLIVWGVTHQPVAIKTTHDHATGIEFFAIPTPGGEGDHE